MDEYSNSYRMCPPGGLLLLGFPIGLFVWQVKLAHPHDPLAGMPLVAVFAYGVLVAVVNRFWSRATAEGVQKSCDPLPCGVWQLWVPRKEIARVYVRLFKTKYSGYLVAGVERNDGQCVDMTEPFAPEEAVRTAAAEIAAALAWTDPITEGSGVSSEGDHGLNVPFALWMVLMVAAVAWEGYRST